MNILVIANTYPNRIAPHYGSFVYNLMQELAKSNQITVISPFKVHHLFNRKQISYGEEKCHVLRPLQLTFSNKNILGFNTVKLSLFFYKRSVHKALKKIKTQPEVIYVHFLLNCLPILDYAEKSNIPIVVASGESTYTGWEAIDEALQTRARKLIKHVICVSQDNKDRLISLGFDSDKLTVVPNAVNQNLFKPLDKAICKQKLGILNNKFVVGFVGHFIDRKGPNRLIEAIQRLDDSDIQLVCVGNGGELRKNTFTKVLEPMPNSALPEIYNAFDVFVLPTLHEGHCNAIEEAKACGIPIISSLGTSVEEQINSDIGILVNPLNIEEIAEGILLLKANPDIRSKMASNLRQSTDVYFLPNRASKISEILYKYNKVQIGE